MDIISQLQEQVNTIAAISFNTFGTLQRDAPPVRLSPNYPEPTATPAATPAAANGAATTTEESPNNTNNNMSEVPKILSAELVKAAKQVFMIFFFMLFWLLGLMCLRLLWIFLV